VYAPQKPSPRKPRIADIHHLAEEGSEDFRGKKMTWGKENV
jgi:hypothetical protein